MILTFWFGVFILGGKNQTKHTSVHAVVFRKAAVI
jgi:hypothetical protein